MCWVLYIATLVSLFNLTHLKYVTSVLNANWEATPLLLEASEFFAEENEAYFFELISKFGGVQYKSEKEEYDAAIAAASEIFPEVTVALLKLSLSLRQYSPRALMFNKIADAARGNLECASFLQINTELQCLTPNPLLSSTLADRVKLTKYDHVYRDNSDLPQTILYCDLRTKPCHEAHMSLAQLADTHQIAYIFRHFYVPTAGQVPLSGYGVELAIKSTEYTAVDDSVVTEGEKEEILKTREEEEVHGIRFGYLKEMFPDSAEDLERFRDYMLESKDDMKPLKAWEISDLGYQACQKIVNSPSNEILSVLAKYSQNLPSLARSLCTTNVKQAMRTEIKKNQAVLERYNVHPGSSVLLLNGMLIDLEGADPFTLLKKLRGEAKTVGGLSSLGISFSDINTLLKSDLFKQTAQYGIDQRHDAVLYINDLEKDNTYLYWPGHLTELLRPTYPGMLKHVKKNIHNLVVVVNPGDQPQALEQLKLIATLLDNSAPIRIGVVFNSESSDPADIAVVLPAMVNYLLQHKGRQAIKEFLVELSEDGLSIATMQSEFEDIAGVEVDEAFIAENSPLLDAGNQFLQDSGVSRCCLIINGAVLEDLSDIESTVLETIQAQLPKLQRAVYMGEVDDETNILDWYMNRSNILPRHNPRIMDPTSYVVQLADLDKSGPVYKELNTLLQHNTWIPTTDAKVSMVAAGDFASPQGKQLLGAILTSLDKVKQSRISLLFTVDNDANYALWSALRSATQDSVVSALESALEAGSLPDGAHREAFSEVAATHAAVAQSVLHITPGDTGVMCNGRVITPLSDAQPQDIELIETLELKSGAMKLQDILSAYSSDVVMRTASVLRVQEPVNRISFPDLSAEHSAAIVPGEGPFQVEAVLDPLSSGAQQISQILRVLHSAKLITLRIILNPIDKLSEMPVRRFYRYVLEPELEFSAAGSVRQIGSSFTDLLPHLLLTMSLSTPINWMVASTHSPYDLDNIKLSEVEQGVHADYSLEYLVIEGHSHDPLRYNNPTKGLQYDLVSKDRTHDTIVMANLGYFQLKAGPGLWRLSLRDGPSKEIYRIAGVEGPGDLDKDTGEVFVTVGDLTSTFITVEATKKPGMDMRSISQENEQNTEEQGDTGIWDSLKSLVGKNGKASDSSVNDTINIFSVASGHLYERMLGVMMQSVLAHTKNPVKFWFLKNYLSPKFINSIPTIAKELGCEVEFVQYQWPSWLQSQTEKQRIIWGYKILFLDVLFPMSLKKIIFVDADQIVRADMKELIDLDLKGAPYGYTPFCDDKPEMDGFRFWNQGYWRNHLMGRRYHISALYVVDLQRFRLMSAGDRLRGQYQGLSQDPNSLANLDQDLPNNMIHHVPIFSLPQEWLWCETWCSDSSKYYAKTIDLCNNPLTKEPKLDRAMRIAPEWQEYDKKLKQILEMVDHTPRTVGKENAKDGTHASHSEL